MCSYLWFLFEAITTDLSPVKFRRRVRYTHFLNIKDAWGNLSFPTYGVVRPSGSNILWVRHFLYVHWTISCQIVCLFWVIWLILFLWIQWLYLAHIYKKLLFLYLEVLLLLQWFCVITGWINFLNAQIKLLLTNSQWISSGYNLSCSSSSKIWLHWKIDLVASVADFCLIRAFVLRTSISFP